jgi:hypothetical protein
MWSNQGYYIRSHQNSLLFKRKRERERERGYDDENESYKVEYDE